MTYDEMEYVKSRKDKTTTYLLWFFLGGLGAHRLYLYGVKSFLLFLLSWLLLIPVVLVWVDLFTISRKVDEHNLALRKSLDE